MGFPTSTGPDLLDHVILRYRNTRVDCRNASPWIPIPNRRRRLILAFFSDTPKILMLALARGARLAEQQGELIRIPPLILWCEERSHPVVIWVTQQVTLVLEFKARFQ